MNVRTFNSTVVFQGSKGETRSKSAQAWEKSSPLNPSKA